MALVNFCLNYFHFWPSFLLTIACQVAFFTSRIFIYEDQLDSKMALSWLFTAIWQSCNLLLVHIVTTKIGFIFVESQILRTGNEQLLSNLEEGVIIFEEDSLAALFLNNSAMKIVSNNYSMIFTSNKSQTADHQQPNYTEKLFARVDKHTFNHDSIDISKTVERV